MWSPAPDKLNRKYCLRIMDPDPAFHYPYLKNIGREREKRCYVPSMLAQELADCGFLPYPVFSYPFTIFFCPTPDHVCVCIIITSTSCPNLSFYASFGGLDIFYSSPVPVLCKNLILAICEVTMILLLSRWQGLGAVE